MSVAVVNRTARLQDATVAEADADLAAFRAGYPGYSETRWLDELRATEYARLDAQGQAYLDYTGAGLYADSQVREHLEFLSREVLGNPHSDNPTSRRATELVEQALAAVLAYFNADPNEYAVVFTANASGALKLVGEAYPFTAGSRLLLTADNHNSVNGIREFAYPAQSNFSGVQHPLAWIDQAQARGWDVLLDAAAFAPTNRLDLRRHRPEFVSLSFYKLFGYPTGIGCLIARHAALARLRRPWFAGGTVVAASVLGDAHVMEPGASGFEDGTVNFLGIPAIPIGLRQMQRLGLDRVHERVRCLTGWLLEALPALHHANGAPLIRLYGPRTVDQRGGTLAFNVLDAAGQALDVQLVEQLARERRISLRTGCFCNPGASEAAFGLEATALVRAFGGNAAVTHDRLAAAMGVEGGGAIRVSVGAVTNRADITALLHFLRSLLDRGHP